MGASDHIILQFHHQQHTGLLAGQGDALDAHRTFTSEYAHTIFASVVVDGATEDGIVLCAVGQLAQLITMPAASCHAVKLLEGHHVGLLLADHGSGTVVVQNHVHASAMARIIAHHLYLRWLLRQVLPKGKQGHAQ